MNIEINKQHVSLPSVEMSAQAPLPDASSSKERLSSSASHSVTFSRSTPSSDEILAAELPEEALVRTDPLGNLVHAAFCLQPPPPPDFTAGS